VRASAKGKNSSSNILSFISWFFMNLFKTKSEVRTKLLN
jgi:hypothetical protein